MAEEIEEKIVDVDTTTHDDDDQNLDDIDDLEDTDDVEELKKRNAMVTEANKKLFARTKKAEGFVQDKDGKWVKKPKPVVAEPKPGDSKTNADAPAPLDPVEQAELANAIRDLSKDEIQEAKDIAKGKGISLLAALDTPAFKAFHKENVEAKKKEDAKLGAGKGSGQGKTGPEITSNMSREDHKAAFEKALGKK